jgi:hypothetical protein
LKDGFRWDVREHVVAVPCDPHDRPGEFVAHHVRVVDHRLAADGDHEHLVAEADHVQRARVRGGELVAIVHLAEQVTRFRLHGLVVTGEVRLEFLARRDPIERQRHVFVRDAHRARDRPARRVAGERALNGIGELAAVAFGVFELVPRVGVLVRRGAGDEQGRRIGEFPFDVFLGKTGPVAAESAVVRLEHRAMARVAEDDRDAASVQPRHVEHGHVMVHAVIDAAPLLPPVERERCTRLARGELRGREVADRAVDDVDELCDELGDVRFDLRREFFGDAEELGLVRADFRAEVRVGRAEQDPLARHAVPSLDFSGNGRRDVRCDRDEVHRHDDQPPALLVLQGERLGVQVVNLSPRRRLARRQPRHPRRLVRRDHRRRRAGEVLRCRDFTHIAVHPPSTGSATPVT